MTWTMFQVNPAEEKLAKWTMCKLSGQKLAPPCVVDELGSLYNKVFFDLLSFTPQTCTLILWSLYLH